MAATRLVAVAVAAPAPVPVPLDRSTETVPSTHTAVAREDLVVSETEVLIVPRDRRGLVGASKGLSPAELQGLVKTKMYDPEQLLAERTALLCSPFKGCDLREETRYVFNPPFFCCCWEEMSLTVAVVIFSRSRHHESFYMMVYMFVST